MKFIVGSEICVGILLACTGFDATAGLKDNPYQIISARNAFGLRAVPMEKVPEKSQPPAAPAVEILLTGVTTLLDGSPRAILEFFDPQTKKTDRPSPFREGDQYDEHIRIVGIDAAHGLVRLEKDGSALTVDFERNGIKEGTSKPVTPPVNNLTAASPTAPISMTREEMLARLAARKTLQPDQISSAANILPPPRSISAR